ncbi:MAG: 4-(cytidine 5'-diphospho)-2-C-methyl-D-erythritol kinase [Acidobacteriota bacterium]
MSHSPANPVEITLPAHAKINWWLEILGKRPDGYHELFTIFQSISLADEVRVGLRAAPGIELDLSDPHLPSGPGNLAWRAAEAFLQAWGEPRGVKIALRKHIPAGAGLGGGSSDAAAVLRALNRLAGEPFSRERLAEIAAGLGSDVPFFLFGGTAVGLGRGEIVRPSPVQVVDEVILVVWPRFAVPTAEAYRWIQAVRKASRLTEADLDTRMRAFRRVVTERRWCDLRNDFQAAVFSRFPVLQAIRHRLHEAGAGGVWLSGSGSALFALGPSEALQEAAKSPRLTELAGCFLVRTVGAY